VKYSEIISIIYSELKKKSDSFRLLFDSHLETIFSQQDILFKYIRTILFSKEAKRLRAFLGVIATTMFNGNHNIAVNFSLVYEIFHTASLIHDDIMDNSDKRRGQKTLHTKYGIPNAIIAGDLLLSKGYSLIGKFSEHPAITKEQLVAILKIVGDCGEKCCIGQSKDLEMAKTKKYGSIEKYLEMIELKTGTLIEGSVMGGAVIGGATPEQIEAVGEFGKNLGIAFQIIDDSLDLLGGEQANKSVMNDLKQGKATPMLIHTLQHVTPKEKKKIMNAAGNPAITDSIAKEITHIYRKYGAIEYVQQLNHEYVEKARKHLAMLPPGEAHEDFNEVLSILDLWSVLGE